MLQKLVDVAEQVECTSTYAALTGVIQGLFVTGARFIELASASSPNVEAGPDVDHFERTRRILIQAKFVDADVPVDAGSTGGQRRVRIPNPADLVAGLPPRIKLGGDLEPAAVVLHAFLLLRIRYQRTAAEPPLVRLETSIDDSESLDTLYLVGDGFTERYPVSTRLERVGSKVRLDLFGDLPLVSGGLGWPRADYVRSRDASVLLRLLRVALEGARSPLVIPRQTLRSPGVVRARVPRLSTVTSFRWLSTLHALSKRDAPRQDAREGDVGEHFAATPTSGGYVAAIDSSGATHVSQVRVLGLPASQEAIVDEDEDSLTIAFEAIGGAREIGSNSYVYSLGHKRLIVDVGFDATKDGWLGLPEVERLSRADVLVLTHAHLDHIGSLPALLACFPRLVVYCTPATRAVLLPQLYDSANVGRFRFAETGEPPSVTQGLVDAIRLERFRVLAYHQPAPVPEIPGLSIEFEDAGHIIGSACIRMRFAGATVLHTGDISVEDQHLLQGMRVERDAAEHVVMEGTYCGASDFTREMRRAAVDKFYGALEERLDAGGSILVPAFSLGRAQELVGMLVDWRDATGRDFPIYTVGLVNKLNSVSAAHPEFLPRLNGNPFDKVRAFPQFRGDRDDDGARAQFFADEFAKIAGAAPSVIIASHGMMTEGTGSFLIGRAILTGIDERNAIFLCGYMDPRTPGFRLMHQCDASTIEFALGELLQRTIPPANIQFHKLTAHASYEELCDVAVNIPTKSVTFIHGDGEGLDSLRADVQKRFQAQGKSVVARAPAIGERFQLCRVPRPVEWTTSEPDGVETLGGRRRRKYPGISVANLDEGGRWALIPVGQQEVCLGLDLDRVSCDSVESVRINGQLVFDATRGDTLGDIRWAEIGPMDWLVTARDPNGRQVAPRFRLDCGAEIRPVRRLVDACQPVLEFHVGGKDLPRVVEARDQVSRYNLKVLDQAWVPESCLLRVKLEQFGIRPIRQLQLRLSWHSSFIQEITDLGRFEVEPRVALDGYVALAGVFSAIGFSASPAPTHARVGGRAAAVTSDALSFVPGQPGQQSVEFGYGSGADPVWVEVATLNVAPSAEFRAPDVVEAGHLLAVEVSKLHGTLETRDLVLRVGGTVVCDWPANTGLRHWTGSTPEDEGALDLAVEIRGSGEILCQRQVQVRISTGLDRHGSIPITTVDGSALARLSWFAPTDQFRREAVAAFTAAGFSVVRWDGDVLELQGTTATIGQRLIFVGGKDIVVWTFDSLKLHLANAEPFVGSVTTVLAPSGEPFDGLGQLNIEADRIEPFFDALSCTVNGNRLSFSNPGVYCVAACFNGRRLVEVNVRVLAPPAPARRTATSDREWTVPRLEALHDVVNELVAESSIVALGLADGSHRIIQGNPASIAEDLWRFLFSQRRKKTKVLVTWPGLTLPALAAGLLTRTKRQRENDLIAYLRYPAPRGELVASAEEARRLREHLVLCTARRDSSIDLGGHLDCPRCESLLHLQTNSRSMWISCQTCGFSDQFIVLTLAELRRSDVDILFAEHRMVHYLKRGNGRKYAGAFGSTIRCESCNSLQLAYPSVTRWNVVELQSLVSALGASWDGADEEQIAMRAARLVARRIQRRDRNVARRLEALAQCLIDAGIVVNGEATPLLARLEHGVSVCCGATVVATRRRIAHVFLGLDQLLQPSSIALHPGLTTGESAIRQFLGLSS